MTCKHGSGDNFWCEVCTKVTPRAGREGPFRVDFGRDLYGDYFIKCGPKIIDSYVRVKELNEIVFSWLKSNGWAGPEDIKKMFSAEPCKECGAGISARCYGCIAKEAEKDRAVLKGRVAELSGDREKVIERCQWFEKDSDAKEAHIKAMEYGDSLLLELLAKHGVKVEAINEGIEALANDRDAYKSEMESLERQALLDQKESSDLLKERDAARADVKKTEEINEALREELDFHKDDAKALRSERDAALARVKEFEPTGYVLPDILGDGHRELEKERDAAREEAKELNEENNYLDGLADAWVKVAHRIGEELAKVGPPGYYDMSADEWREWALKAIEALRSEAERMRKALVKIRDCDWVISLPDRMDAVRDIARKALAGGGGS